MTAVTSITSPRRQAFAIDGIACTQPTARRQRLDTRAGAGMRRRVLATSGLLRRDRSAETSWAIGIRCLDIANPVVAPLIKRAQHEARRNDCTLVVWDFDESAEDEATVAGDVIEHVNASSSALHACRTTRCTRSPPGCRR